MMLSSLFYLMTTIAMPHEAGATATSITIWSAVPLAFLGGMTLNMLPCVFPVLFLKAFALLQTSSEPRSDSRAQGVAYTLGIVVSFWLVVGGLLALRATGRQLGWGFQLQSPGFVVMLACFLFLFALSLAGVFDMGLSFTNKGDSLTRKAGHYGSFFTGVLATVVATPCVGPFMGAAIGFALAQSAAVTFFVFTSLALGLATPYLILSFHPAWVRFLPKPGVWMDIFKRITALPLMMFVIWLVYVFGRLFGGGEEAALRSKNLLISLLLVGVAAWILRNWPARRGSTLISIGLVIAAMFVPFSSFSL